MKTASSIGIIFSILFLIFSFLVIGNFFAGADLYSMAYLQSLLGQEWDFIFSTFSLIGSFEIAMLIILLIWIIYKKLSILSVLVFFAIFHIIELTGKFKIDQLGPPPMFHRYDIPFVFPSSGVSPGFSYPSGHAGRTAFISAVLITLIISGKYSRNTKVIAISLILIFDLFMYVSRVYLGEHWATDVIGGIFLGTAFGLFSLTPGLRRWFKN